MPLKLAGKIVLPTPRDITLEGQTTITLENSDCVLKITTQSGTDPRLLQLYPYVNEGRMLWIWNASGANAVMGRAFGEPGYLITSYDMPPHTITDGTVAAFRFYADGAPAGAVWSTWHRV
jgi:hypothetical protein